jgi:hypothetical protein
MSIPWLPPEHPRLKAYILRPGIVQIEDTVYNLPARSEEKARSPPTRFEFVLPAKENSPEAARRAMEDLYRIVFD